MAWKIYFWLLALYLVVGYVSNFVAFASHNFTTGLDLLISVPSLLGLYNYAFGKFYLPMTFWKVFAIAFPIYELTFNIFLAPNVFGYTPTIASTLLSSLPFLPLYVALLLYAYGKKTS